MSNRRKPPAGSSRQQRRKQAAAAGRGRGAGRRVVETDDLPELQKARALWQAKRFPASLALFEKTVRDHPRNLLALTDAARAFGARYELDKAERYLGRMLELAPDDPVVLFHAGQSYRMIYRPERALSCLVRAVELRPQLLEARLELALLLERAGRLDEAQAHADALCRSAQRPPEALVIAGRLSRRLKDPVRAREQLTAVLDDDAAFWATRQHAGMELARLHDEQGEYGPAERAASQAKAIARPHVDEQVSPRDRQIRATWEHACHHVSRADLDRWAQELSGTPARCVALLTGPPRSGTTLLENILDAHPALVSSDERDAFPRFIHGKIALGAQAQPDDQALDVLERQTAPALVGLRERYLGFMQSALGEPIGDRLHLDKNPSISTLIPGVLRLLPECKIILALRDPRDVVVSCYFTHMPLNSQSEPYLTIEDAVDHYVKTMDAWLALREQLVGRYIELRYEDVVQAMEAQARRVLAFLGLEWDDAVLGYRDRTEARPVNSPTYEQVQRPLYRSSIGRWRNYRELMDPHLEQLRPYVEAFGYDPAGD